MADTTLRDLVAQTFQIPADAVTDDLEFGVSPSWDSINHVNLMLALEDTYQLAPISDDDVVELTTLPAIRAYLARVSSSLSSSGQA